MRASRHQWRCRRCSRASTQGTQLRLSPPPHPLPSGRSCGLWWSWEFAVVCHVVQAPTVTSIAPVWVSLSVPDDRVLEVLPAVWEFDGEQVACPLIDREQLAVPQRLPPTVLRLGSQLGKRLLNSVQSVIRLRPRRAAAAWQVLANCSEIVVSNGHRVILSIVATV